MNDASSTRHRPRATYPTLNDFIQRLQVLQALGAGNLPVVVESRARNGTLLYAKANARRDSLALENGQLRQLCHPDALSVDVVRVG